MGNVLFTSCVLSNKNLLICKTLSYSTMSEWVFVKPKKGKKKQSHKRGDNTKGKSFASKDFHGSKGCEGDVNVHSTTDINTVLSEVSKARSAVKSSKFYKAVVEELQNTVVAKDGRFKKICLLGLGSFSTSKGASISILQLAFALELVTESTIFQIDESLFSDSLPFNGILNLPSDAVIFDPAMTSLDSDVCSKLGLLYVDKISFEPTLKTTLYFMPHCPFMLYNQVIWTNWNQPHIENIVILGNSFESYNLRHHYDPSREWRANCVNSLSGITSEVNVWNIAVAENTQETHDAADAFYNHFMENAFNDTRFVRLIIVKLARLYLQLVI